MSADEVDVGGRPPKYQPDYAEKAKKLCLLGATDDQLADFLEVDVRTIYRWKHDHAEFCDALRAGKEEADARVVRSLYQRAVGYEQDDVKIFMPAGASNPVYAPFTAKIAPDTTAAIFWLKNRNPGEWRDKREHGLTDGDGNDLNFSVVLVPAKTDASSDT